MPTIRQFSHDEHRPPRLGGIRCFPDHPIRGKADRQRANRALDAETHAREALLHTVLICFCLWGGFWLQFLTSFPFNQPQIHTLSGGNWPLPGYGYFIPAPSGSPLPFSMAGNFVLVSAIAAPLALLGGWLLSRGAPGKWRMRLAIFGFATLTLGYALAALPAEDALRQKLKHRREMLRQEMMMPPSQWKTLWLREQIIQIDETLEKLRK